MEPTVIDTAPLLGQAGQPLNAPESRTLRAACGLQRIDVAALANALSLLDGQATVERITRMERSTPGGYPPPLCDALRALEAAVDGLALDMVDEGRHGDDLTILRRPLGAKRIVQLLALPKVGLDLSPRALAIPDERNASFWHGVIDAVMVRAATEARAQDLVAQVVNDIDPAG